MAKADVEKVKKAAGARVVVIPELDEDWHPIARRFYEALQTSGQSVFYEDGDWMAAFTLCESMSREFKPQPLVVAGRVEMRELPPKAASLAAWAKVMSGLLVTEGDRRRARLELERPTGEEADDDVSWIADARARLRPSG